MTWTLWRGADLLGTVHPRSVPRAIEDRNHRRHVDAVLVPDPAFLPLQSVYQHVMQLGGKRIVQQHAREPHVTRVPRHRDSSPRRAIGVWPVSGAQPLPESVPSSQELQIRDAEDRVVPARSIGIVEHRPHPDHPPTELATLPEGAFVRGSIWLVHFSEDLGPSAT